MEEEILLCRKHILLDRDGGIIIDTGAPASFHRDGIINFGNRENRCSREFMGVNPDYISRQLERPLAGLLGMDILSQFDNVVFDYANHQILLDCDVDEQKLFALNSNKVMGVSCIELEIDGRRVRMIVDTGAPVSYISPIFTNGRNNLGSVEDFHPGYGQFTTNTYMLPVLINGIDQEIVFGNLPAILQKAIGLLGADGIIGYDLFARYTMMLRHEEFFILDK